MEYKVALIAGLILAASSPAWASSGIGKGVDLRNTPVSELCFVDLPLQALRHNSPPSKPCWGEPS